MAAFSSRRERRLWLWAALVVAAIYLTLGFAQSLAGRLNDGGLASGLFILACLMVLAAVITQGLKTRPSGPEIGVGLGIVAAYILVLVRISIPAERTHLIEYGVLALLVHEALRERSRNGAGAPRPALTAVAVTALVGVVDEVLQLFMPSRVFDWRDMLFNGLAAIMAVTANGALHWIRARSAR